MDKDNEGLVQTGELKAKISDYIPSMPAAEIEILMDICDSRKLNCVVITNFIEKLQTLS